MGISWFSFASKPDLISLGAGVHDIIRDEYRTSEFRIEYKPHNEMITIRPLVGMMITKQKSFFAYGGFWFDWILRKHFLISPNFAAGFFSKGHGKTLGYPLEFRSGIELGWRFSNEVRMGVHFYHISNASLGHKNPGEESLVFSISFPINKRSLRK